MNARDTTYEGWKNRATWNVALFINNDYGLYMAAREFMRQYKGRKPYSDFVRRAGLTNARTMDNFKFNGSRLCYRELNSMMRELVEDLGQ